MSLIIIGIIFGVVAVFGVGLIVTLIDERKGPRLPKTVEEDPGLDVALHRIRRQRELDEFKLDSRIAARQMRRDGLRQMRLSDDGNDTP